MEMVGKNCNNLETLKRNKMDPSEVERLEHTGNVDVYTIVRHMRQLKHLELQFSTLTDIALDRLCKACSILEYLDLFGCLELD
ncbi:unnamed protein product [Microthlaspi erraticum]|uniref:Uncharacterized protein n=1 Tax=Microthlaspi erraticum TaxID=1685480 RepID=A0A6D2I8F7_9BRAS|nr:unnamed protein product [Microthlaspi erraticum]